MRLVNARTLLIEEYIGHEVPPYAILSHTWGEDEVTYQSMSDARISGKAGMEKIRKSCQQALRDSIDYVWVDTCCIDKTSSADLSEAINSMFQWYERSEVCYAFLADVPPGTDTTASGSAFSQSRWFTRGWTLQELIAPQHVHFYSSEWTLLGTRSDLCQAISSITSIRSNFLMGDDLNNASLSERMSWASRRNTTREEDMAYCLFGIFNINMPLVYGEGKRAFMRLQEEIMKVSDDESLFAWGIGETYRLHHPVLYGLLAESPASFAEAADVTPNRYFAHESGFRVINNGVKIKMRICNVTFANLERSLYAILNCHRRNDPFHFLAIPIRLQPIGDDIYGRLGKGKPLLVPQRHYFENMPQKIYMQKTGQATAGRSHVGQHDVVIRHLPNSTAFITQVRHPDCFWDSERGTLTSYEPARFSLAIALISPIVYAVSRDHRVGNPFVRSRLNAVLFFSHPSGLSFTITLERRYMSWCSSTLVLLLQETGSSKAKQIELRSFPRQPGQTRDLFVGEVDTEKNEMKAHVRAEYLRFGSKNVWLVDVGAYCGENPWELSRTFYRGAGEMRPIAIQSLTISSMWSLGETMLSSMVDSHYFCTIVRILGWLAFILLLWMKEFWRGLIFPIKVIKWVGNIGHSGKRITWRDLASLLFTVTMIYGIYIL